jgi:TolB-like protein/Flp pilus assembly protein TadD
LAEEDADQVRTTHWIASEGRFWAVKTTDKRACPSCGTLFPDNSETCPVCALRGALGNEQSISVSPTEPTLSPSQLRFEHYEVLTLDDGTPLELGRGAMGVTYKGLDVNLRCAVALKVINAQFIGDESARRRFMREARAAASVRHTNVASVFHLGKSGDSYFYAMEFVDGESLDKVIRRSSRLDPSTALKVTALVAAGLEAIDKQNLVHRDIKPSNIMVSFDGDKIVNAKIIDLGLAKGTLADDGSISKISIQGAFAGTPAYAGPEQFAGVGADIRSDLYSLGITLWEMLAGEVPFKGSTSRLIYQHQHATPPVDKLTHVPQPVIALLEVLLEKDPDRRLQTPTELLQVIPKVTEALESGRRVTTDQLRLGVDGIAARPKQSTRRFHWALTGARMRAFKWLLASVLGIAGLLLAWFFFSGHGGFFFNQQVAQAVPTEKSIAVLPFENISANKDDAYFADGVQDEILNNLAKIAQLKVISRTSVMQYRAETKRDLRQIATALGVTNVLEGTVRRDGNHVRVSTDLVDARNDNTIWADSYDRDLTDIFAIQSQIAQTVATKLSAQLSPEERRIIQEKPTSDLEAYDLYLQAKALVINASILYLKDPRTSLLNAIGFLEEATRRDSKFALAYCLLANAHDYLYNGDFDKTPERRALGDAAIDQALRLGPDLPEVHLAAAFHRYACYRDYQRARVQIAIAERALPNSPDALALAAYLDRRQGRWLESTKGLEKAVSLDPRNHEFLSELAGNYFSLRRYADYRHIYDRLIELEPDKPILILQKAFSALNGNADLTSYRTALEGLPSSMKDDIFVVSSRFAYALSDRDWATAKEILSKSTNAELYYFNADTAVPRGSLEIWLAYVQEDRPTMEAGFAAAREQLNRKVEEHSEDASLLSALAVIDAALGRKQQAIEEAKRAVEMLPVSEDAVDGPSLVYNLAAVYSMANERDLAFQQLAVSINTPGGATYGTLKLDPCWDPIRKDPRFDKLLAELAPKD